MKRTGLSIISARLAFDPTVMHKAGDICNVWLLREGWYSLYRIKTIKRSKSKIEGTLTSIHGGRAIKFSTADGDQLLEVLVGIRESYKWSAEHGMVDLTKVIAVTHAVKFLASHGVETSEAELCRTILSGGARGHTRGRSWFIAEADVLAMVDEAANASKAAHDAPVITMRQRATPAARRKAA
ncbi:MAG: hypothetical protein AB7E81_20520 [Hyphomicrobiaceae bacterium]